MLFLSLFFGHGWEFKNCNERFGLNIFLILHNTTHAILGHEITTLQLYCHFF